MISDLSAWCDSEVLNKGSFGNFLEISFSIKTSSLTFFKMAEGFECLGVAPWLVASLKSLQIDRPTAIQAACIGPALAGRDVVGCGETGAGKTLAFGLPIVQGLGREPWGLAALVLTPARELAEQIGEQLRAVGAPLALQVRAKGTNPIHNIKEKRFSIFSFFLIFLCMQVGVVIGGMDQSRQSKLLASRPHVVVATPGRMAELVSLGVVSLAKLAWLVLDEADRLLALGFQEQLKGEKKKGKKKRKEEGVFFVILYLASYYFCLPCKETNYAFFCDHESDHQGWRVNLFPFRFLIFEISC